MAKRAQDAVVDDADDDARANSAPVEVADEVSNTIADRCMMGTSLLFCAASATDQSWLLAKNGAIVHDVVDFVRRYVVTPQLVNTHADDTMDSCEVFLFDLGSTRGPLATWRSCKTDMLCARYSCSCVQVSSDALWMIGGLDLGDRHTSGPFAWAEQLDCGTEQWKDVRTPCAFSDVCAITGGCALGDGCFVLHETLNDVGGTTNMVRVPILDAGNGRKCASPLKVPGDGPFGFCVADRTNARLFVCGSRDRKSVV